MEYTEKHRGRLTSDRNFGLKAKEMITKAPIISQQAARVATRNMLDSELVQC